MAAPDEWELVITSTSRLQLERALDRLLLRDAALLESAITGQPIKVPRVHLLRNGACCCEYNALTDQITDDPMAATCVHCKGPSK